MGKGGGGVPRSFFREDIWRGSGVSDFEGSEGGRGVGVGVKEESEWIRENKVGGRGKSNAEGTTNRSKLESNNI